MRAPDEARSPIQSSTTGGPAASGPFVPRKVAQQLRPAQWLALAAGILIASTGLLFSQHPWKLKNFGEHVPRSWWLESLEWNSVRGLPDIKGNINAVAIQPGSSHVWIAGDLGLLASSGDAGDHWTKLEYDATTGTFSVAGAQSNTPTKSSIFSLSWHVDAALLTPQSSAVPPSRSPAQQAPNPISKDAAPSQDSQTANQAQESLIEVPSLIGMNRDVAEQNLLRAGLVLGKVVGINEDPTGLQIGMVLRQNPIAGERVRRGSFVYITVGVPKPVSPELPAVTLKPQSGNRTAPASGNGSTGQNVRSTAKSAQFYDTTNWPAPHLLSIDIASSKAGMWIINSGDGRVFDSTDSGRHWTARGLPAGAFNPATYPGGDKKGFNYASITAGLPIRARVVRLDGIYYLGDNNTTFRTRYQDKKIQLSDSRGKSWSDVAAIDFTPLSLWFSSSQAGCAVGYDDDGGVVQCTRNIGKNWLPARHIKITKDPSKDQPKDRLVDVTFSEDGNFGWAVGRNGVVLWTGDGGDTWQAKTQSAAIGLGVAGTGGDWWRLLPPWFYAAWVFGLICAAVAPLARIEESPVDFIQDYAANDRPLERGDRDALDFTSLAKALSAFVRNSATKPPLTISIDGAWGSGKSSLMNLMCADLREFGFHAVWFNAWHNQKEEHLLAALLQTVRADAVPPLWDLSGVGFRCRLVGYRLKRYWFPMLLVSGLAVFLFALDYYHYSSSPDHHSLLVDVPRILPKWLGGTGQEVGGVFAALNHWPSLGTLLGLAALWPVVKKLLQAFGTNPAALLATLSKGNRIADLDEQISFREKFSKEFRDVTRSLGEDHQLVVFIDDLDRCRPENVRDVLEAVNFLVTSGECFVVMGLERRSVVAAVGLSLKDIAAEMAGKSEKDDAELIQSRREYASHFLDKLINLEVPIPRLDPDKARGLFYDDGPRKASDDAKVAAELRRRARVARAGQYARFADGAARFLFALLLTGALGWRAYKGGEWLNDQAKAQVAAQSQSDSASKPAQTASGGAAVPPTQGAGQKEQDKTNLAPPEPSGPPPEIKPGSSPRPDPWKLSWPELAAIALLAAIAYSTLVGTGKGARHDSPKFIEALEIWYPLVIERQGTPRAVKRWMNRVRYLATREMPASELRSPFERFADWYVARTQGKVAPPEGAVAGGAEKQPEKIPEEIVVALAAIHEFDSGILTGAPHFDFLQNVGRTSGISSLGKDSADQLISRQRALHVEKLGQKSWEQIVRFAPRFLNLWPTIDIH